MPLLRASGRTITQRERRLRLRRGERRSRCFATPWCRHNTRNVTLNASCWRTISRVCEPPNTAVKATEGRRRRFWERSTFTVDRRGLSLRSGRVKRPYENTPNATSPRECGLPTDQNVLGHILRRAASARLRGPDLSLNNNPLDPTFPKRRILLALWLRGHARPRSPRHTTAARWNTPVKDHRNAQVGCDGRDPTILVEVQVATRLSRTRRP